MTLTTRLALVGASSLLAGVIAFALPLPASLQSLLDARQQLTTEATPAGACGCLSHGRTHHA